MTGAPALAVRVAEAEMVAPRIRRFALVPRDGGELPRFSAGSHVVVAIPAGRRVHRNPYSLIGSSERPDRYEIAVRRADDSRGGSAFLHDAVRPGDELEISQPGNLFPIVWSARRHLLIAGGIGITPFLAYMADLAAMKADFGLHYAVRSRGSAAFLDDLATRYGGRVHVFADDEGGGIPMAGLMASQPLGTHLYVCGPAGMIEATLAAARAAGWPERNLHSERFVAAAAGRPFSAVLAKSGRTIDVPGDMSLLEALEANGVTVPHSCRGGACGQCETVVLEGAVEHRDFFLSAEARASNTRVMPCVSRSRGPRLVLDL